KRSLAFTSASESHTRAIVRTCPVGCRASLRICKVSKKGTFFVTAPFSHKTPHADCMEESQAMRYYAMMRRQMRPFSVAMPRLVLWHAYQRGWYVLETLHKGLHQPVVEAAPSGRGGGGARIPSRGERLMTDSTASAAACAAAADPQ